MPPRKKSKIGLGRGIENPRVVADLAARGASKWIPEHERREAVRAEKADLGRRRETREAFELAMNEDLWRPILPHAPTWYTPDTEPTLQKILKADARRDAAAFERIEEIRHMPPSVNSLVVHLAESVQRMRKEESARARYHNSHGDLPTLPNEIMDRIVV